MHAGEGPVNVYYFAFKIVQNAHLKGAHLPETLARAKVVVLLGVVNLLAQSVEHSVLIVSLESGEN